MPDTATDSSAPQAAAPESSATKADTETSADAKPAADGAKSSAASKTTSGSKPVKAAKAAKPKSPPGLTVTLAYQDGEWTVAAQQGAKTLAKPYLVKPAEALKMVGMVDVPGVQEAVSQLVANERAEAEQRAEALRAQLTELETHLAELRDAT